jgi:hypothetical protein
MSLSKWGYSGTGSEYCDNAFQTGSLVEIILILIILIMKQEDKDLMVLDNENGKHKMQMNLIVFLVMFIMKQMVLKV